MTAATPVAQPAPAPAPSRPGKTRTLAIGHRGLSAEYAENSLPAFLAAADAGADGVELDVRLTADGRVVVLHDATIDRTTDGNGRVAEIDYSELESYDTGDGPIPSLDELFAALADWDGQWNIEVKAWQAATAAAALIEKHDLKARSLISSIDPRALRALRAAGTDVDLGLIVLGPPDDEDIAEALDLGCSWFNVDHDFLDAALVSRLHDKGFKVAAWTVNDTDRAREMLHAGVDAIMSDERSVLDVVLIEGQAALPAGG